MLKADITSYKKPHQTHIIQIPVNYPCSNLKWLQEKVQRRDIMKLIKNKHCTAPHNLI